MPPLPVISPPFQLSSFTLDISGVAGLFGGDEVVEAASSLHLYKGRKWRGWYNSPGAYAVAKYFGCIANSQFWRGLFPGDCKNPVHAFGLDGKTGPRYMGVFSGTEMMTGHIGYLLTDLVNDKEKRDLWDKNLAKKVEEKDLQDEGHRATSPTAVTIVDVMSIETLNSLFVLTPPLQLIFSYFTMLASVVCTIFSLLFNDIFCFVAILIGVLVGGISSFIIGSGTLTLNTMFEPAPGSPPGDGVLISQDIIVLRGSEVHVNAITKGKFKLKFEDAENDPKHHIIGVCATLYFIQFIAQLLLIPQGTLAGQVMFLISFAIAWINNCILASIDKDAIQTELLGRSVKMKITRFKIPTRTMATFFACLALRPSAKDVEEYPAYKDFKPKRLLESMLPNDTRVWQEWRRIVLEVLESQQPLGYFDSALNDPQLSDLREDQRHLLSTLLRDAQDAYLKYEIEDTF